LLNVLSTLVLPDEGEVTIFGEDALAHPGRIKARCNMSSGHANFPWSMTVRETLNYYGMLYGLSKNQRVMKIDELLQLFELEPVAHRQFQDLSTGTKQRLSLAKALMNDPALLFLDEPTVGLDPDIAHKIREVVKTLVKQRSITALLTTHYMAEAEMLSDRIAFLKNGQIKTIGTAAEIKEKVSAQNLEDAFMELAHE